MVTGQISHPSKTKVEAAKESSSRLCKAVCLDVINSYLQVHILHKLLNTGSDKLCQVKEGTSGKC